MRYTTTCPVCQAANDSAFLEISQVPVHCNVHWNSCEEALAAPRGDLHLGYCPQCGHIYNQAFEPALTEYTQTYENSLHFSPRFQAYATALANHLINRYNLRHKDIIDIGCGKGDFLKLICQLGNNRGVGFDRSYEPTPEDESASTQVTFVQDFYAEAYAHYAADLICCRHVLEHIQFPQPFLTEIAGIVAEKTETTLYFEVPNGLFTLRDMGIWDLIYEHCSYFSATSLAYLFRQCGFEIHGLEELYTTQFLGIEAVLSLNKPVTQPDIALELAELNELASVFANKYQQEVTRWRDNLKAMSEAGQRIVVWGGGSKGVTFLNVLQTQNIIDYVVDINPRKQGLYVAGTGQQIVSPEFLKTYQPHVVLIMNPVYKSEIHQMLTDLNLEPELISIL